MEVGRLESAQPRTLMDATESSPTPKMYLAYPMAETIDKRVHFVEFGGREMIFADFVDWTGRQSVWEVCRSSSAIAELTRLDPVTA